MTKKLGERLIDAGLVSKEAVEQALQQQRITGRKLGDCLVEIGLIQEGALLRFLAAELNTRFVSAEKLSKAKIAQEILDKVPVRMAEAQVFLPLALDPERKLLTIVAAEPQNKALIDELALVAQVDEVYAYVGLRSAIAAAIKKHYYGDPTAFTSLFQPPPQTVRADLSGMTALYESGGRIDTRNSAISAVRTDTDPRMRVRAGTQISRQAQQLRDSLGVSRTSVHESDFVESLQIMVTLLESGRASMRGHSAQLARQATMVGRRLGLPPRELSQLALAALLHDVGKRHDRHCTVLANGANAEWKADAKRYLRAPLKLFENVRLPAAVTAIVSGLFETWDGSGVPAGVKGEEIPIGARILAVVDAFLDLAKNPANAFGKTVARDEAFAQLQSQSGKLFDPTVVDALGVVLSGEPLRRRIENDGRQVVIADPDEAARTDLSEVVTKLGLVARALTTLDAAVDAIVDNEADLLVLGYGFGSTELATVVQYLRSQPETAGVPIIVAGEFADAAGRERMLQMGADTTLGAPVDFEAASAAIEAAYRGRVESNGPGQVVKGSFDELAAPELYRTLATGRKSGKLTLRQDGKEAVLQLEGGRVLFATLGAESGEAALRSVATLANAEFLFDPEALLMDLPQLDAALPFVEA